MNRHHAVRHSTARPWRPWLRLTSHRTPGLLLLVTCCLLLGTCRLSYAADEESKWTGVDERVVEKIAADHGRPPTDPIINTDQGDLLLFVFLGAGAVGGFAAGYYWHKLISSAGDANKPVTERQS